VTKDSYRARAVVLENTPTHRVPHRKTRVGAVQQIRIPCSRVTK